MPVESTTDNDRSNRNQKTIPGLSMFLDLYLPDNRGSKMGFRAETFQRRSISFGKNDRVHLPCETSCFAKTEETQNTSDGAIDSGQIEVEKPHRLRAAKSNRRSEPYWTYRLQGFHYILRTAWSRLGRAVGFLQILLDAPDKKHQELLGRIVYKVFL